MTKSVFPKWLFQVYVSHKMHNQIGISFTFNLQGVLKLIFSLRVNWQRRITCPCAAQQTNSPLRSCHGTNSVLTFHRLPSEGCPCLFARTSMLSRSWTRQFQTPMVKTSPWSSSFVTSPSKMEGTMSALLRTKRLKHSTAWWSTSLFKVQISYSEAKWVLVYENNCSSGWFWYIRLCMRLVNGVLSLLTRFKPVFVMHTPGAHAGSRDCFINTREGTLTEPLHCAKRCVWLLLK